MEGGQDVAGFEEPRLEDKDIEGLEAGFLVEGMAFAGAPKGTQEQCIG